MAAKIPVTSSGLTEEQAIQAGTLLRSAWDVLRSLNFNKKASILRHTITTPGKSHLGIEATKALVSGLANLDVYVSRLSTREVLASNGLFELTDMLFVFYTGEVKATDQISYENKTYDVIQVRHYDADSGQAQVVARMV